MFAETQTFETVAQSIKQIQEKTRLHVRRIIIVFLTLSLLSTRAAAESPTPDTCTEEVPPQLAELIELLELIQRTSISIALVAAAIMLILVGLLLMRSRPEDIQRAKRIFVNTMLGLVVIFLAGGLVELVRQVMCGG